MATEHAWVSLASSRPDDRPEWPAAVLSWVGSLAASGAAGASGASGAPGAAGSSQAAGASEASGASDGLVEAADASDTSAGAGHLVDAALSFALELGRGRAPSGAAAASPAEAPRVLGADGQTDPDPALPLPGTGRTAELWEALATFAALDLAAARAAEPHLDALAILAQAGRLGDLPPYATWGVFAAEGGSDPLLALTGGTALRGAALRGTPGAATPTWTLTGTKPWCSLADRLDRALVSATVDPASTASTATAAGTASPDGYPSSTPPPATAARRLFAVDLHHPGVTVLPGTWHARGLTEVPSGPVHFDAVPAEPIGDAGWYLDRPGFSWGGIGVAACWFGGAVGVGRMLAQRARDSSDPLLHLHLGVVDERLGDARRALAEAAALVDSGSAVGEPGRLLAKRARATVARASEDVLRHVGHALGPAPLALDSEHAKRVADLELYLRQHHAEKDSASLGRQLSTAQGLPW